MHRANSVRYTENSQPTQAAQQAAASSMLNQFSENSQPVRAHVHKQEASLPTERGVGGDHQAVNLKQSVAPQRKAQRAELQQLSQQQQQSQQQQPGYMKSCLSEGDFNEILIKVSDGQDSNQNSTVDEPPETTTSSKLNPNGSKETTEDPVARRRSSCSDAD